MYVYMYIHVYIYIYICMYMYVYESIVVEGMIVIMIICVICLITSYVIRVSIQNGLSEITQTPNINMVLYWVRPLGFTQ